MATMSDEGPGEYQSPWRPIYACWSRLRCLSDPNPAPSGGEAAVRFALNTLLPGELSPKSFREKYETLRTAGNPPAIQDGFETVYER